MKMLKNCSKTYLHNLYVYRHMLILGSIQLSCVLENYSAVHYSPSQPSLTFHDMGPVSNLTARFKPVGMLINLEVQQCFINQQVATVQPNKSRPGSGLTVCSNYCSQLQSSKVNLSYYRAISVQYSVNRSPCKSMIYGCKLPSER